MAVERVDERVIAFISLFCVCEDEFDSNVMIFCVPSNGNSIFVSFSMSVPPDPANEI